MPFCKFTDCGSKVVAWGMCDKHYRRSKLATLDEFGNYPKNYQGRGSQTWKDNLGKGQRAKIASRTPLESLKVKLSSAIKKRETHESKRVVKKCGVCGIPFKVNPASPKKFCSYSCGAKGRPQRAKDVMRNCIQCRQDFICHGVHEYRNGRKFCSVQCRAKWQATLPYKEWRGKIGDSNRGKLAGSKNGMYGVAPSHGKWRQVATPTQGKVMMRSTWEAKAAKYLDMFKVSWLYEPKRFNLGDTTYLPDFYIPEWGCYWEVKGWFSPRDQKKIHKFREMYPEETVVVVSESVYSGIAKVVDANRRSQ